MTLLASRDAWEDCETCEGLGETDGQPRSYLDEAGTETLWDLETLTDEATLTDAATSSDEATASDEMNPAAPEAASVG
jgi:hypothetical protein